MILIISVLGILMINFASADIIPENSHPLNRCVKFVNLNDFPDVVLIGYYTGPMINIYEAYQIENNKCLDKGYKFNSLSVFWTSKEKFSSLNLTDLKIDPKKVSGGDDKAAYRDGYSLADIILLLKDIEPYGGYVNEKDPLVNEIIEYSVAGYSDGNLVVYISKKTSGYNNGKPEKVETFEKPNINNKEPVYTTPTPWPTQNPEPLPVKKGFWDSISCFFEKLVGGSC